MTIENLQIEVEATSNEAVSSLEKLESVLQRIEAYGNSSGLDKLYQKLRKIASLDFSNRGRKLKAVVSGVSKGSRSGAKLEKGAEPPGAVPAKPQDTASEISSRTKADTAYMPEVVENKGTRGFEDLNHAISGTSEELNNLETNTKKTSFFSSFKNKIKDVTQGLARLSLRFKALPTLSELTGMKESRLNGLKDLLNSYAGNYDTKEFRRSYRADGFSTTEIKSSMSKLHVDTLDELRTVLNYTDDRLRSFLNTLVRTEKQGKRVNSTFKAMKTILMYSLLFSALSAVMKGVSKGFQNVAMYSKEANDVLTQYKTLSLQLSNSLGAALIPVLQLVYPLIQLLTNVLIDLANAINILASALNGSESFIKAKKYTDDYAKSLGKLKGMAGMDQIHTLGQRYNYSEMFEKVEIGAHDVLSSILDIAEAVAVVIGLKIWKNVKKISKVFSELTGKTITGKAIFKKWAGIFLIIEGVELLVDGIKDLITNGKSLKNTLTIVAGILAIGAGIALVFGAWIPLAIAAVIAALAALAIWGDEVVAWFDGVKAQFDGWITGITDKVMGFFDNIIDNAKNFCPAIAFVLDIIKNAVGAVFDSVKAYIDWGITLFQDYVKIVKHLFSGDFKAVWEDLKSFFKHWWEGFANLAISPINFLISCFEALVNFFIRGINVAINTANSLFSILPDWFPLVGGDKGFRIKQVSEITLGRISGFSTGGFPEDGLFFANHNELVGQFNNGKTAVANNEQIIEGIKRGVKEANEESGGGGNWVIQLVDTDGNIKSETIITATERRNRRDGRTIIPIGV